MTIETALWPLQQAIYRRLSSDLVPGAVTGVHDVVSEEHTFPYITVGEPNLLPFETKNNYSEAVSFVVHAWSDYEGKKQAYHILNEVFKAIGKGLSIEGPFVLLEVKKPTMQVIDDADPRIKHGIARFKVIIKNK